MNSCDSTFGADGTAEPVEIALREISETKRLLEGLITSSESFDYLRAKATLQELQLKVKLLGRLQTELLVQQPSVSERIIPFPAINRVRS